MSAQTPANFSLEWFSKIDHVEVWVQNLVLALTAGIGIWTLRRSSQQERRRATVDVVLQGFEDPELIKSRKRVNELVKQGLNIPHLLSNEGSDDRFAIFTILNRYEFIAAGLREKAFDREVYKRVYYSSAIRDWENLHPLIAAFRIQKGRRTAFQEFESLILGWKNDPLAKLPIKRSFGRRILRTLLRVGSWIKHLSE